MPRLHIAVQTNNIIAVQEVLQEEGIDVNERDGLGNTSLHLVKNKSIASLLIDAGADPKLQNKNGDTPLHTWHIINSQNFVLPSSQPSSIVDIVSLLLEAGASPNIQNNRGYNALHSLFVYGGIAGLNMDACFINDVISLFVKFDVDVNMVDFEGCTPLHHAVKEPHALNAEMLLTSGALIDVRDHQGMTPLQNIFSSDNIEMVQLLLINKASINSQDCYGRSTLFAAVEVGNEEVVRCLLQDPSISVNIADKNKVAPLHLAAAFKHVELTGMLIRASSDLNACDAWNATPLHYAAYGGTPEIVTMLLEAGADDKLVDNSGRLAVHYALSRHYFHTAMQFGEEYLSDVTRTRDLVNVADTTLEDIILQILPADDIFTLVVPASIVYTEPLDPSCLGLDDLVEYTNHKAKSVGKFSNYLQDMCNVPGVGRISPIILQSNSMMLEDVYEQPEVVRQKPEVDRREPEVGNFMLEVGQETYNVDPENQTIEQLPDVGNVVAEVDTKEPEVVDMKAEVEIIKQNIERFMSRWAEKIAELDERFAGSLFHSGSVYEGTKVEDPNEFDFMLCLEKLAQECSISYDEVTEYDKMIIRKNMEGSESFCGDLFDGEQLESGKLMGEFVDVAKNALTKLDLNSVPKEMYIEGLTEHTLVEATWVLHGTVTCNLKLQWAGLYYKQLVITVDLVPAIPIHKWPPIARQASYLLSDDIRSRGCHLVPKDGYWRLSFSLAEQLIMQSLSLEQKSAFIASKVILHPAVSCKIMIYDDTHISTEEEYTAESEVTFGEGTVQDIKDDNDVGVSTEKTTHGKNP